MWIAAEEPPSSPWGEEPKRPGERVDPVREFGTQLRRSHQVARYNVFLFVRNSPVSSYDPDGNDVIEVGSIYYAEGIDAKGERFTYTGKTRRQLDERLATHHKKAAILADKTSIEERKVVADIDLTQSTAKQNKAKDEALAVVEYDIMAEADKKGIKSLNEKAAGEFINIESYRGRYNPRVLGKVIVRKLAKVPQGIGVVADILFAVELYRAISSEKKFLMAPYVLADSHGVYTLRESGIPFINKKYEKHYVEGEWKGRDVEVSSGEFVALQVLAEKIWGYVDWKNDWQPGVLQKELPKVIPNGA